MTSGRTLVWDLGGVVLRWEPVELVREALGHLLAREGDGAPSAQALTATLFDGFARGGYWEDFDRGRLDLDDVAAAMAGRSGLPVAEVRRVLDAVPAHLAVRPDTVALVERVRAAGHRVVYLSNMPLPYVDGLDPVLRPVFSAGVFSGCVGQVKPDADIFATAVRLLDLDPARLLFLDDRPANVEAAQAVGWPARVFTDAGSCARDLAEDGWL